MLSTVFNAYACVIVPVTKLQLILLHKSFNLLNITLISDYLRIRKIYHFYLNNCHKGIVTKACIY